MCHSNIWPGSRTLKKAPILTAFSPSLACVEIHCESKFDWERYPVNAVPIEPTNATAPVTQVNPRLPRQAAMKNLPHRWITMNTKNNSTLHKCVEFTKWPADETCHHSAPLTVNTTPVTRTTRNAASVAVPNM